jgi:hypothetical protein
MDRNSHFSLVLKILHCTQACCAWHCVMANYRYKYGECTFFCLSHNRNPIIWSKPQLASPRVPKFIRIGQESYLRKYGIRCRLANFFLFFFRFTNLQLTPGTRLQVWVKNVLLGTHKLIGNHHGGNPSKKLISSPGIYTFPVSTFPYN